MARSHRGAVDRDGLRCLLGVWREETWRVSRTRANSEHKQQTRQRRLVAAAAVIAWLQRPAAETATVAESFCYWRLALGEELRRRLAVGGELQQRRQGDVQTLVDLLQQSTTTCKQLRICLLEARRGSRHSAWLECYMVMRAWCSFVRPRGYCELGVMPMTAVTPCM